MKVYSARASLTLPLEQTHSIDTNKKEVDANIVTSKVIKDNNFGGHGERSTVVPNVQAITYFGSTSSEISSIADDAVSGELLRVTSVGDVLALSSNSIKVGK